MRILKRCLLLPLFCCSFLISGCNNDIDNVKKEFLTTISSDFKYDDLVVERVNYGDNSVYLIKMSYQVKNMKGEYVDKLEIWVYSGDSFENIYCI